ncbi:MAG: ABC transporter permease [Lachnospiraceae bacterium]|nr:ABC transporter permease [Lachnospiraceae bacterium]
MIEELCQNNRVNESVKSSVQKQMYLIKAELLSLRLNWQWSLLIVLVSPLSVLFFLYLLMGENVAYMPYIVTGNIVMSLVTGTMLTLGQELGLLKQICGFEYYAVLPIKKIYLIVAYLVRATLTTIPSILILMFVGKYILKLPIRFHVSFIVIVLLSGISLSALGAFIGMYSKDSEQASIFTQVIQPVIVYCAPVFMPLEQMPQSIKYISYLIPTTHVANALRASLGGQFDWVSIGILVIFSIISIILVEFKMDWRQK